MRRGRQVAVPNAQRTAGSAAGRAALLRIAPIARPAGGLRTCESGGMLGVCLSGSHRKLVRSLSVRRQKRAPWAMDRSEPSTSCSRSSASWTAWLPRSSLSSPSRQRRSESRSPRDWEQDPASPHRDRSRSHRRQRRCLSCRCGSRWRLGTFTSARAPFARDRQRTGGWRASDPGRAGS